MAIDFRLLAVSDRSATLPATLPEYAAALTASGVHALLLREHDLGDAAYTALLDSIRRAVPASFRVIVHSRVAIAAARHADLHLREAELSTIPRVRAELTPGALIGVSTHSLESARAAERAGASYIIYGPVFDTPSKRQYGAPQGEARLREICDAVSVPVIAIGGIKPSGAAACQKACAHGIACISALLPLVQIPAITSKFRDALGTL